jgi:hypothetical protein
MAHRNSLFAVTVVLLAAMALLAGVACGQEPAHLPTG